MIMDPYTYSGPSPFPPSFDGSPFAYGLGLFGDVVSAALALTMLLAFCFEYNRFQRASRAANNRLPPPEPAPLWSALFLYRVGKMSILMFVVMRTLPDAVWMLAWGEVPEPTIRAMLAFDLWADGFSIIPLCISAFCWSWGGQVIPQLLVADLKQRVIGGPTRHVIIKNGRIILIVFMISVGVTFGKVVAEKPQSVITIQELIQGEGAR